MILTRQVAFRFASIAILVFSSSICSAQQEASDTTLRVYYLKNAVAADLCEVVATALNESASARLSADSRTNSLLLMASQEDHKKVHEIITAIDVPSKQPEVKVFALAHSDCIEVAETLVRLVDLGQETTRLSYDKSTNSIVALAHKVDLERIEALIMRLDQPSPEKAPTRDCRVRVTWLTDAAALSPEQVEDLAEPGRNLKSLVDGLKQESMNDVKSITVCATRVGLSTLQEPKRFGNSSFRTVSDQDYSMGVEGSIKRQADGKYELEIAVELIGGQKKLAHSSAFSLPPNHPVALSVSDFGNLKSVIVIEVIDNQ